jgi:hypothetical protein
MISFEVSPWTANDRDDETDETMGMAYGGYSCSNDQTFCKSEFYMKNETERASDMVSTHLRRLGDAYPEVPVYLASYGKPTHIQPQARPRPLPLAPSPSPNPNLKP